MNDKAISYIRTYVPVLVGLLISWLASKGLQIDAQLASAAGLGLTAACIGGYYALARVLEARFPKLGVLLGVPKAPVYPTTRGPVPDLVGPESGLIDYNAE